MTAVYMD